MDGTLSEDDQILAAIDHPASEVQFTIIDDNDELRRVIEGGDFAKWRTFLHPTQRKYAEKNYRGTFRLCGGAGTGKTVVALHRARNLAKRNKDARIILTTFNKTLALDLKADLRIVDPALTIANKPGEPGIYVAGIDQLTNAVLNQSPDLGPAFDVAGGGADCGQRARSSAHAPELPRKRVRRSGTRQ